MRDDETKWSLSSFSQKCVVSVFVVGVGVVAKPLEEISSSPGSLACHLIFYLASRFYYAERKVGVRGGGRGSMHKLQCVTQSAPPSSYSHPPRFHPFSPPPCHHHHRHYHISRPTTQRPFFLPKLEDRKIEKEKERVFSSLAALFYEQLELCDL